MPSAATLRKAKAAAKRYFAARRELRGVGLGWTAAGEDCVKVLLAEAPRKEDPATLAGVPVVYEVVGRIAKKAQQE